MDEYINKLSPEMQEVLPYLLSGGAGALATSIAASGIKRKPEESRLAHLGKKLAIALGGGLAGAGIYKGVETAKDSFQNALPLEDRSPEENLVSATTNPNVIRGLASGGVVAGSGYIGSKGAKKELRSLLPEDDYGVLAPEKAFKRNVSAQSDAPESKLTSWIAQRAEDTAPETKNAKKIKDSIETENAKLKKAIKDGNDTAELERGLRRLNDRLAAEESLASSKKMKNIADRLEILGYEDSDFAGDTAMRKGLNTAKGMGRRGWLNLVGRSTPGRLGRAGALATAALSPEIASYIGDLISSDENE
jgi:hypothetical protein